MRLFVANTTNQHQIVFYRPDIYVGAGFIPPHSCPIKPGRQENLGGELEEGQINEIVKQLRPHGFLYQMEIPGDLRGVCPYVGNINQPVSEHTLRVVMAHNEGNKLIEGSRRRERAAIGANEALKLATAQANVPEPPEFDVEFEQMTQTEAGEDRIEAGYHVVRDLADVPAAAKRGPGRPKKA